MIDRSRLKTDLLALALLAATVFVALSLFSYDPADPPAATVYPPRTVTYNTCGPVGAWTAHLLRLAFGSGAWFVLLGMGVVDVRLFSRKTEHDPLVRGFGWGLLLVTICIAARAVLPRASSGTLVGSGGLIGAWGMGLLQQNFSAAGVSLLLLTGLVVGMLLTTDALLFRVAGFAFVAPFVMFHRLSFGRRAVAESIPQQPLP